MKIRTRLTLQNTFVVAAVFLLCMVMIYVISDYNRSYRFYRELRNEAVTRVNLFLMEKIDMEAVEAAYSPDRKFPGNIVLNVYDTDLRRLYHNRAEAEEAGGDVLASVPGKKYVEFKLGKQQGIGILHHFKNRDYVVTATAYDADGMANLSRLLETLVILFIIGLTLLFLVCYYLAYHSLRPIREIVREVENITEQHIHKRLPVASAGDELGELATAFNDLLGRMETSFDSQKMFVSNVSHEMRTPLAAIIAGLDISLQKERTAEEYKSTINDALLDARRMNKLIDGLLNLAKASYHKEEIKKQRIRLDEMLLDARANILRAHPDYQIEIVFEEDSDDDDRLVTVEGNLYLLTIAFSNLIENNCKYSADNSSFIQISYWDKLAIVRLSDSGIGMSEKDKENMFTLFYRGERDKVVEGHGIGMALSQRIIHLHEGNITVYSEEGRGTTFVIELPHI